MREITEGMRVLRITDSSVTYREEGMRVLRITDSSVTYRE